MKAFISYSHKDENYLQRFHIHLAVLKRDKKLDEWTDNKILVGQNINSTISTELRNSQLFIALISPDYLASKYCYEKELEIALEMKNKGDMIIVPIILEPCEWKETSFKNIKVLPKDGKPISEWNNENTAFLNIIESIRHLIDTFDMPKPEVFEKTNDEKNMIKRNYKSKRDFDEIDKIEFAKRTFTEIKTDLSKNVNEINNANIGIKARVIVNDSNYMKIIIVNRNKIDTQAEFELFNKYLSNNVRNDYSINNNGIEYKINNTSEILSIHDDEFTMYWQRNNYMLDNYSLNVKYETSENISDYIWEDLMKEIGVMY